MLLPLLLSFLLPAPSLSFQSWGIETVERKVEKALKSINQILNFNKNPTFAANVPHSFDDKFSLAESLVDAALASHLSSLNQLGLPAEKLDHLSQLSRNQSVLLRFLSTERCSFLREESHEVESGEKEVKEGVLFSTTTRRLRTVTEYFWNFEVATSLQVCVKGGGKEECEAVASHSKTQTLKTSAKQSQGVSQLPPIDLDATWFFREVDSAAVSGSSPAFPSFRVNRTDKNCFTPVHNRESLLALKYFDEVTEWTQGIANYFRVSVFPLERLWLTVGRDQKRAEQLLERILEGVFIPVVPIMSETGAEEAPNSSTTHTNSASALGDSEEVNPSLNEEKKKERSPLFLTSAELDQCLLEEKRTMSEGIETIEGYMSDSSAKSVLSADQVKSLLVLRHMTGVSQSLVSGVLSIEAMLERQLFAAIGREVTVDDVTEYMKLRGQQLFRSEFRPSPMTYAVRRSPSHSPEGTLSLERNSQPKPFSSRSSSSSSLPSSSPLLHTVVRREVMALPPALEPSNLPFNSSSSTSAALENLVGPMSFALSDASRVTMTGERYLHSYLHHQFGTESSSPSMTLSIRARQFSSFIVLLGTISSSSSFEPIHAFIVQNKDEMRVPLEMEFIPSLKEFRKAISSLSPQQKQFAEAIRELQMSNTLFGVAVIQIKPQLEKVLNLPRDSLTKEIGLTEDLLKLFIEYQIPSDLLSFDELSDAETEGERGDVANGTLLSSASSPVVRSVEKVQEHVKAIQTLINSAKEEELREKKQTDDFHNRRKSASPESIDESGGVFLAFGSSGYGNSESLHIGGSSSIPRGSSTSIRGGTVHVTSGDIESFANSKGGSILFSSSVPESQGEDAVRVGAEASPKFAQDSSTSVPPNQEPESPSSRPSSSPPVPSDLSALPNLLQNHFDQHGSGESVRPGIIRAGSVWRRQRQANLFSASRESPLGLEDQRSETQRAFDLLDALTRSGGLTVEGAMVHVVLASSHYFPQSLLETVIQRNLNPLLKLEESTLLMASVIHDKPAEELVA